VVDLFENDGEKSGGGSSHVEKLGQPQVADSKQLLAEVTEAVRKAKQAQVPVKEIADAVYNGVGLIIGENPFDRSSKNSPGWGNGR
jgi:hypothetical protein